MSVGRLIMELVLIVFSLVSAILAVGFWVQCGRLRRALQSKEADLEKNSILLVEKTLELYDKNIKLEKWVQSQSDFIMIASHQLRTPLTGVKWGLGAVLAEPNGLDAGQREQIASAMSGAEKMLGLINDLLRLVKIESGHQS